MPYYTRIAITSLILAVLTILVLWFGPRTRDVTVIAQSPNGPNVPAGADIRMTFSRPVDRASVEHSLAFTPTLNGKYLWEAQTLTFRPTQRLAPQTTYTVTLQSGLLDQEGRPNVNAMNWSFRTRSPRLLLISPAADGSGTLWLTALDGGDARQRYTAPTGLLDVAVAPDGMQAVVVVVRNAQQQALWWIHLEDGRTRSLVDDPAVSASAPAWSPTGDIIAFERRSIVNGEAGAPVIWLAQPDGTSLGPISRNTEISAAPVWSPDGSRLAYVAGTREQGQMIGIATFTSAARTYPDSSGEAATWSPDGTALVYRSLPPGRDGRSSIGQIDVQTEQLFMLTNGADDQTPQWSPDGQWIVFVRRVSPEGVTGLWRMRADGSNQHPLTNPENMDDSAPTWSPDGQHIAFVRTRLGIGGESSAWLLDVTTGAVRQVRPGVTRVVWVP